MLYREVRETIADNAVTRGVAPLPGLRYSVRRSRCPSSGGALRTRMIVSNATLASRSSCPPKVVRRMSPSLAAQSASRYHFVSRPVPRACASTSIHDPAGVAADHEAMSSSKANGAALHAEVQVPYSYVSVVRDPKGSVYVPSGRPVGSRASTRPSNATPSRAPAARSARTKLTAGRLGSAGGGLGVGPRVSAGLGLGSATALGD